jgi:hypothetical protein
MHVVVVVSHRHPRDCDSAEPERPGYRRSRRAWELRLQAYRPDGRGAYVTSSKYIHTTNGCQKRTSCIFCPLHLTDTIERRHQSPTRGQCISSATQTTYLRHPPELGQPHAHLCAKSWRCRSMSKGTGREIQICSQKCPMMPFSLIPSSYLQQVLIVCFHGYADLACRTSHQHATYTFI